MSEQIGGTIRKVIEVDVQEESLAWERMLRVKVECELKKLLARGGRVTMGGDRFWIPFQYEKLPKI